MWQQEGPYNLHYNKGRWKSSIYVWLKAKQKESAS